MALASTTAENNALTGLVTAAGFVSIHTATTGTTGAAEVSGGSPPYARVAITWGSASAGSIANTNTLTLNIPTSTTVTYAGTWSLVSAGVFQIGAALTTSVTFNAQGTLTIAAAGLAFTAT